MVPIDVSCAVIIGGDKVLMTQRSEQMDHPLQWEFPGGKCMSDESYNDCLRREIFEELGVFVDVLIGLPSVEQIYPDKHIRLFPFICKPTGEEISLSEHRKFAWFRFDELERVDILPADAKIISYLSMTGYL
ncbi:MAG TPA: (deoxy)nucleoside triphosphate pyrophosphohydrolase [Bacteroidales bacterium]|nr:(deoxy)nucleoside triphosphate pyrophosphohydrolase [Bacteroidales bacterium]